MIPYYKILTGCQTLRISNYYILIKYMGIIKQLLVTPQYLRHSFSLVVISGALEITKDCPWGSKPWTIPVSGPQITVLKWMNILKHLIKIFILDNPITQGKKAI